MKARILTSALAAFLTLSAPVLADSQEVLIDDVWARATVGANRPAAVYITFRNTGGSAVKLAGISTDIAERAEVHLSQTDNNGVTTMRPAGDITIPSGKFVEFQPGGLHIMLMNLNEPLTEGDTFKIKFDFDDGESLLATVRVRGIAARGPEG